MNRHNLLRILADGKIHTAKNLTTMLAISSSELIQQIQELVDLGVEVIGDEQVGYFLSRPIILLTESEILAELPDRLRSLFKTIFLYPEIDSTNAEAIRFLKSGERGVALFIAEQQNQGRGRRGNAWISPLACNIYMSLILPCSADLKSQEGLSLVTALSLVKSLRLSCLIGTERLRVKWPNDIWLDDKKLAGILLELHQNDDGLFHVIIGIGINVQMPIVLLNIVKPFATDLAALGNKQVNRNLLIARFIEQLHTDIEVFSAAGFRVFRQRWQRLDRFHQKYVEVKNGTNIIYGKVKGVSFNGALMLETSEGDKLIMGGELAPTVRASNLNNNF